MTIYTEDQTQESITGYLWYDAPWAIIRAIYPWLMGNVADLGAGSGIMADVLQILSTAQGIDRKIIKCQDMQALSGCCSPIIHTVYTSHVIEHLSPIETQFFIDDTILNATKRIIHVVPEGDVHHINLGTLHQQAFNRRSFLNQFKPYETTGRLKRIHYGPIKGDRMDSLIYVGDVIK